MTKYGYNTIVLVSTVYAKCSNEERIDLWEELEHIAEDSNMTWVIGGDFNVILREEKTMGGLAVTQTENRRVEEECIFKRLDRILVNQEFLDLYPSSEVHHLVRHGLDHAPVHMICNATEEPHSMPFRFLHFWTKHKEFKDVVRQHWKSDRHGSPFIVFQDKLKNIKKALSSWSRNTYSDVFQKIATLEELIKEVYTHIDQPSPGSTTAGPNHSQKRKKEDLQEKVDRRETRYLAIEEEYWRQKTGMTWFKDGDRNIKFFHSYVRGRRKKLHIDHIKDVRGNGVNTNVQMGEATTGFFQIQLSDEGNIQEYDMLQSIPKLIEEEQNEEITKLPSNGEEWI
ncbi:hypothetical protein KY289_035065 [Solanum tuberosum]|nr:hypothetical protein KY289_035065 [Solanum tuberosum]